MRLALLATTLALASALAGCTAHPRIQVEVVVVGDGFSGGNFTLDGWDPSNAHVASFTTTLAANATVVLGSFEGQAGAYTLRAAAGLHVHQQEDVDLPKGTTRLYVLANDGRVDFSLDGVHPL